MTVEHSQQVIDRYFEVMASGGDFSQLYTDDVTWTMVNQGHEVRGRQAVHNYVVALHEPLTDGRTRQLAVSDNVAYLEGDCIDPRRADSGRVFYCIAYDLTDSRISAMRCYGDFGAVPGHR